MLSWVISFFIKNSIVNICEFTFYHVIQSKKNRETLFIERNDRNEWHMKNHCFLVVLVLDWIYSLSWQNDAEPFDTPLINSNLSKGIHKRMVVYQGIGMNSKASTKIHGISDNNINTLFNLLHKVHITQNLILNSTFNLETNSWLQI